MCKQHVRYVRDYLDGSTANSGNHWVEIEVWGTRTTVYVGSHWEQVILAQAGVNVAPGKAASQSSTYPNGCNPSAAKAVDGNTSGQWSNCSVTHTNYEPYACWQVDLGASQPIQSITLWNRTDCCSERLSHFYVFVSDTPFASTDPNLTRHQAGVSSHYIGSVGANMSVAVNRTGRYVRVQLAGTNYLSLAEVQVWSGPLAPATSYYYVGSTRVAMRTGSAVYYLHSDHLGSASLTTDASGNKVGELRYTPYGETRSGYPTGNVPTDRRYTGQAQEESLGLYFYNARWYDSTLGRFLSADTLVPSPGNPQSLNRYSYGYNNPVKYIDSTGHFPILPLVILAGIGIGIVMHELLAPPAQDISPLSIEPIKTPRAEPPTSPDMTEWLVDQMQTTAKAPVTQAFQEHFSSLSPADQLGALKAWVAMVRTDAVWDFKGDIQAAELPGLPIVTLGGQQLNYQAVANIFFGFEGRATGQAGWFLKAGAGAFQAVYWLPKNSSNVGPVTTSFDDPFDNWSIGFGIFLYDLYGQNLDALTPEAFSTALEQYTEQYGAPPSPLTP